MTEFDPRCLIDRLPPWPPADAGGEDASRFRRWYGLDFEALGCEPRLGQIDAAGFRIAVHRFTPPQPMGQALVVHGYHDHHGLYRHLIRYLLQRQLEVTCFDLPGHGLSSGERGVIDDFGQYQQVLARVLETLPSTSGPLHLFGQSTGAAILNHFLLEQRPNRRGRLVMLAPLVRPAQWLMVQLSHSLLSPWCRQIPRKFTANSNDPAFLQFLQQGDPLQARTIDVRWVKALRNWLPEFMDLPPDPDRAPLIIQGETDQTVDWRYNLRVIAQKFPGAVSLRLPGARHQLVNEIPEIRADYQNWLDQQLFARPLSSGSIAGAPQEAP